MDSPFTGYGASDTRDKIPARLETPTGSKPFWAYSSLRIRVVASKKDSINEKTPAQFL